MLTAERRHIDNMSVYNGTQTDSDRKRVGSREGLTKRQLVHVLVNRRSVLFFFLFLVYI